MYYTPARVEFSRSFCHERQTSSRARTTDPSGQSSCRIWWQSTDLCPPWHPQLTSGFVQTCTYCRKRSLKITSKINYQIISFHRHCSKFYSKLAPAHCNTSASSAIIFHYFNRDFLFIPLRFIRYKPSQPATWRIITLKTFYWNQRDKWKFDEKEKGIKLCTWI